MVLVRPWTGRSASAGCCGGGEGLVATRPPCDGPPHAGHTTADPTGAVYEELRARFQGLDVTVADSRNWLWLLPSAYRDTRRRGVGRLRAARAAARATTPGSLVLDGEVCLAEVREPHEAVEAVARSLG